MLTVKCQSCGAIYKLAEDLYSRKAAGFGVVVTCRRCKSEIHVDQPSDVQPAEPKASPKAPDVQVLPSPERATAKATAPWPEAPIPSPAAPAVAPEEPPKAPAADAAASPAAPRAMPGPGFPRPRPPAPAGPRQLAKRDPVSGPFVALSPGLLGGARPEPLPDSERPVDSSDFIDEPKRGASPKAPPVRPPPARSEQKEPPQREPALPLKIKERPSPPKQKPRPPIRPDDVSDDLLSADVGFDGKPPVPAEPTPAFETETPRILAPDALALAAPPPESKPPAAAKLATTPTPSTSDARPRETSQKKSSRVVPIALLTVGAVGAFVIAFRSQLTGSDAPKPEPATDERAVAAPPPASPPVVPPMPPPIEPAALAETPSAAAAAPPTPGVAPPGAPTPGATSRSTTPSAAKTEPAPGATSTSSAPKPAITAPAPGATEAPVTPAAQAEGPFDAAAARTALAGAVAQASACRKPGDPSGVAAVTITFSPSGRVTSANIAGPPFAGTPTGGCIAATLRRARVPPFTGDMVTVRKTVEIQ